MNTIPIRISPAAKKEIDRLMEIEVKRIFEEGQKDKVNRILKYGFSYAEFIEGMILAYKQSKRGKQ